MKTDARNARVASQLWRMAMLRDATYAAKHAFGVRSLEFAMSAGTAMQSKQTDTASHAATSAYDARIARELAATTAAVNLGTDFRAGKTHSGILVRFASRAGCSTAVCVTTPSIPVTAARRILASRHLDTVLSAGLAALSARCRQPARNALLAPSW